MIKIVYDCKRYHEVLRSVARSNDLAIEIGPHIGGSTKILASACEKVIAVDKAAQAEDASKGFPDNVQFIRGDARFFSTVAEVLKLTKSCDVFAIDMGGGRFPDTVFKVWAIWSGVFKPRDTIIRCRGLAEFLKRADIDDPSLDTLFDGLKDSGWLSQCGRATPIQLKDGLEELQNWMPSQE
jgi:hypothetical protein